MTLSTSLFNKGIYKNIISRFKWGSFLYFIILFFSVPFAILVQDLERLTHIYANSNNISIGFNNINAGLILTNSDYSAIAMLLAVCVPTVVAALVYNSVHSQKQGIFIHGLPVTRKEVYVSTLLASFTLMGLPVILNGIILMIMSLLAYSQIMYLWTVFYWIARYLAVIFIMFSLATFTAYLTGNAAANIAINVLVHIVPMLFALAIFLISEVFLFGFAESDSFIASEIMNNTPIVWIFGKIQRTDMFKSINMWMYLVGAMAVYVITFFLYKNRKIESCGDVAAFKWFRPILKYTVVAASAIAIFGILVSTNLTALPIFIVAIAVTCIVYFASEMLMNKTFKVFGTYKGFLAFLAASGLFISFFAYTSVFGYETRVPELTNVVKATVYGNGYPRLPYVSLPDDIDVVRGIHKEMVSEIEKREKDPDAYHSLNIRYELKNGKNLVRRYEVTKDEYRQALTKMYNIKEYKAQVTGIENLNIDNVNSLDIDTSLSNFSYRIAVNEDAPKILHAVEKDLDVLSYKEIELESNTLPIRIEVTISSEANEKLKFFKKIGDGGERNYYYHEDFVVTVNSNYKHTVAVLKELGYYDEMMNKVADSVYICKNPGDLTEEMLFKYKDDEGAVEEFMISPNDCAKLGRLDGRVFADELFAGTLERDAAQKLAVKEGKNYFVFVRENLSKGNIWLSSYAAAYKENELPEYMKKYVLE